MDFLFEWIYGDFSQFFHLKGERMKYQIRYVVAKTTEDEKVGKLKKGTVLWEGEADTVRDGYRAARQALPEQLGRSLQRLYDEGVVGRGADPR